MNSISTRLCEGEKDVSLIIDLMSRVRTSERLHDYPLKVNIEEDLASAAVRSNTRLWFDLDRPVAWAYVDKFHNLWWEMDKGYEDLLCAQIIHWAEHCARKTPGQGKLTTLDASCRDDDAGRITFLEHFGFQRTEGSTIRMMRDLSQPIPEPALPQGFLIRPIAGVQEAETVAAMHRAAFGTDYMTTENRLTIMQTSEYDSSLDLIVAAPDGTIAANCICSVDKESKTGNTDPIATHPKYQRMGLARALLLTGLGLLKKRGISFAQLGTSSDNIGMQKTAESVGFEVKHKIIWFSKEVA
jgi:GNAT superfamily N-acetyltransferase